MTRPVTTPGRLVAGRYRLQRQLGGGGMGTVWLARDELLGREVAIKQVLTPVGISAAEADQQRQRALREGRIAARLSHPHAISVYDVALESGQPWLVMEYLPSRSLAAVLTEDGVLRSDQVAQIGAQVADALAATHAAGIVHRDVKPANILIGEGGRVEGLVKITDFGISHASGDVTLTQTGQITGTPAFLAPEVAQGHPMTEASDVFSLGATLYTSIEGAPPFGMEDNALAMLHRVAGGSIVPPRRAGSLTEPLQRMLAADPGERPTMADVRDELATLAAGRDGDTTTVLLARTDLRSSAPGRDRTAALPVEPATPPPTRTTPTPDPAPAAAPAVVAAGTAAAVADRPPVEPPPRPPVAPRRKRGRGAWIAAAVVALLVAGLVAVLLLDPFGGGDRGTEAQESPTTSAAPSTSAEPTPTADGENESSGSQESGSGGDAPAAEDPVQAVTAFFALVPGDLPAAHALTSPDFQAEFPLSRFSGFWDDYSSVQIGNVEAEDETTALVDITYVSPDGSTTTERHRVTFVRGDDGRLLVDRDVAI
ncbi:serine/threonine-protein kinase [Blastococcus litoris]|uniref:serine/threonine-protein kinase n=1 Tax=Blastococcus litoris TaxID=2171622 RepID=UPI000E3081AC|nr:serine/threonine-protein kinase [Blastococcus litoris]